MRIISLKGCMLSGKSYIRKQFEKNTAQWDIFDLYNKYNCFVDGKINWTIYRTIDIAGELNNFLNLNKDKQLCIIEHVANKTVDSVLRHRAEELIEIALAFPADSILQIRARERDVDLEDVYKLKDLFKESSPSCLYTQEEAIQIIKGLLSDEETMGNQDPQDI